VLFLAEPREEQMSHTRLQRYAAACTAASFGLALALSMPAFAMESVPTASPPSNPQQGSAGTKSKRKIRATRGQKQQRSDREFMDHFWVAYNLIYKDHDYAAGIAKLHSLGHDDMAEVANLIGYSSRKLGRYDEAKYWYEKALAANPNYARTWSYYGMWYAEQGDLLKAQDILEKVRSICGTECKEYTELKGALDGTIVY
jgi:tetratricopeptide (TPR) repeat protein